MARIYVLLLSTVLMLIIAESSILARTVPHDVDDEGRSESRSHECEDRHCAENVNETGGRKENSSHGFQSNSTTPSSFSINDTRNGSLSIGTTIKKIEQHVSSSSASEEVNEAERNYGNWTDTGSDNSTKTASSEEFVSESTNSSTEATSTAWPSEENQHGDRNDTNDIPNSDTIEQRVVELREKMQIWQNAVSDYLQTTTRRRRETDWTRLLPSAGTSLSIGKDSTNQIVSAAGSAVGDALKPAMELMNQGIDLLNDLYSTHLTKPSAKRTTPTITNENTTAAVDQFRGQMENLQSKLGDLGKQLQKVVGTFQDLQVPFLDGLVASGGLGTLNNIGDIFTLNNIIPAANEDSQRTKNVYMSNDSKNDRTP